MYSGILTAILLFSILYMVVSRAWYMVVSRFNIMTMLLSMWVPHAAGVLQTRTNKCEVGLTFNTFWTEIKITSNETKELVSRPYMKAPI